MIESHQLQFAYSAQKQFSFPDIICLGNSTLLILGQSGKGKTTLLHLLALLLSPKNGDVIVNGVSSRNQSPAQQTAMRAKHIGIVYQKPHFVNSLHIMDNLLLANYLANRQLNRKKAIQLAEHLDFTDHLYKKSYQLSQGEQQRVGIARALMNEPQVILADEPTSSLDDVNCNSVVALLKNECQSIGASLVVVTHDFRLKEIFPNQIQL